MRAATLAAHSCHACRTVSSCDSVHGRIASCIRNRGGAARTSQHGSHDSWPQSREGHKICTRNSRQKSRLDSFLVEAREVLQECFPREHIELEKDEEFGHCTLLVFSSREPTDSYQRQTEFYLWLDGQPKHLAVCVTVAVEFIA